MVSFGACGSVACAFEVLRTTQYALRQIMFRKGSVRRILAVPQGRLRSVDMSIRERWEVWVLGLKVPTEKIGALV